MLISISTVASNCPYTNPALIVTNPISVKPKKRLVKVGLLVFITGHLIYKIRYVCMYDYVGII